MAARRRGALQCGGRQLVRAAAGAEAGGGEDAETEESVSEGNEVSSTPRWLWL